MSGRNINFVSPVPPGEVDTPFLVDTPMGCSAEASVLFIVTYAPKPVTKFRVGDFRCRIFPTHQSGAEPPGPVRCSATAAELGAAEQRLNRSDGFCQ